jgi:hypothetical protein
MNPEQQQIAIAEAHGRVQRPDGSWFPIGKDYGSAGIPNYPFDLNAMHEVEKFILSTDLYIQYVNYLFRSVGLNRTYYMGATPEVFPADRQFAVFHATAAQRAEAFLRTIGKWKECK